VLSSLLERRSDQQPVIVFVVFPVGASEPWRSFHPTSVAL
jgi:hypothetical protein